MDDDIAVEGVRGLAGADRRHYIRLEGEDDARDKLVSRSVRRLTGGRGRR